MQREVCLEALQGDTGERLGSLCQFLRRQEQLVRRQDRALDVVAALLVAMLNITPQLLQGWHGSAVMHDHRIARQVVEERRGAVEEQGHIELAARWRKPLRSRRDRHSKGSGHPRNASGSGGGTLDAVRIQGHFPRRQQPHASGPNPRRCVSGSKLRMASISVPNRSIRSGDSAAHRKHIQQRAPNRELARGRHLPDADVAGIGQALPKGLDTEGLAQPAKVEGATAHIGDRRQTLQTACRRPGCRQPARAYPAAQTGFADAAR